MQRYNTRLCVGCLSVRSVVSILDFVHGENNICNYLAILFLNLGKFYLNFRTVDEN